MGGSSAEREISLATGNAVVEALRSLGHEVDPIDPVDPLAAMRSEELKRADVVFVALHGGAGEDGRIQALLELEGKSYVGSGPSACAVTMDKLLTKHILRSLEIPTPQWRTLPGDTPVETVLARAKELGSSVVLKPACEGSAIGVCIEPSEEELRRIWQERKERTGRWMLERYIPGRELTLPMVAGRCTPLVEILPKEGFYDYQNKYTPGRTEYRCPAELEAKLTERVHDAGLRLWDALNLHDMARMDIRLDGDGRFWILELNTIPGMTQTSLLPMGAKEIGLSFPQLCEALCEGPLERARRAAGGTT
jgi:D-alanine-D-alanine ligase